MANVFDTQYVIVIHATAPPSEGGRPTVWVEGSKHGGTIWTGLRGQGGATAVARRAAEAIEDDLVADGWTDVAVHVLPVNANEDIDAGFARPEAKEERRRRLKLNEPPERVVPAQARKTFFPPDDRYVVTV